jgi:hypothetical protein
MSVSGIEQIRAMLASHGQLGMETAVATLLSVVDLQQKTIDLQQKAIEGLREELQHHKEQADARHTNINKRLDGLSGVHGAK